MAQLIVIVMCRSERGPPVAMPLLAPAATKRRTAQKADYVPGHIIGQFFQGGFLEGAARVGLRHVQQRERAQCP
jgi:hypothetical protein